ncbi:hypothetical protein WJX74_004556 [Apatococcus lobatus]|uniref:Pseudouridine synthase RsuA/RluA-like domain-containing protein n=1 Tax=Apatococcus lobatus TaxID=904363 RepID=A0AAW1RAT5_9CHLO
MSPPSSAHAEESAAKASDFYVEGGLQMVVPYPFEFWCHVKKRWEGLNVIDLFSQEFKGRPRSYYEDAFRKGRLRVEGSKVTATTPLKTSQRIIHSLHRHEPPVLSQPLQVVGVTDDLVAVSKPATWPVHATGQHRKNTVAGVLEASRPDLGSLHPVHRLDKPVSGLLLFARHSAAADDLRGLIQGHAVTKVYVARVQGCFPEDVQHVDAPLCWDPKLNLASVTEVGPGTGNNGPGREASTEFRRLAVWPDGQTSLVECRPLTGRTHQIRVHLQHVGHPIANDTQYGGTLGDPSIPVTSRLQVQTIPPTPTQSQSQNFADTPAANCDAAVPGPPSSAPAQGRADSSACGPTANPYIGLLGATSAASAQGNRHCSANAPAADAPDKASDPEDYSRQSGQADSLAQPPALKRPCLTSSRGKSRDVISPGGIYHQQKQPAGELLHGFSSPTAANVKPASPEPIAVPGMLDEHGQQSDEICSAADASQAQLAENFSASGSHSNNAEQSEAPLCRPSSQQHQPSHAAAAARASDLSSQAGHAPSVSFQPPRPDHDQQAGGTNALPCCIPATGNSSTLGQHSATVGRQSANLPAHATGSPMPSGCQDQQAQACCSEAGPAHQLVSAEDVQSSGASGMDLAANADIARFTHEQLTTTSESVLVPEGLRDPESELEAQIRAKQERRRAERNASLIQSQDLLAARHAAPPAALPIGGQLQAGRRPQASEPALEWHNGYWQPPKDRQRQAQSHSPTGPPGPEHPSAMRPPQRSPPPGRDSHSGNQQQHGSEYDMPYPASNRHRSSAYDVDRARASSQAQQQYAGPEPGQYGTRADAGRRQAEYRDSRAEPSHHDVRDEAGRRPAAYNPGDGHSGEDMRVNGEEAGARALADRGEAARMTAAALQKLNYRAELEAQLREQEAKKRADRRQKLLDDLRIAQEAAAYNPWGRGGCGAPLRSSSGRAIADLSEVQAPQVT